MVELSGSTPDLSARSACRSDAAFPTEQTTVPMNITGLQPWTSGDSLGFVSSQACTVLGIAGLTPGPQVGATSYSGSTYWIDPLPQAARSDVIFLYQKVRTTLGDGAALAYAANRFARLTNFSLPGGSLSTALAVPPSTGSLRLDLRWSQFAALAADVHPNATSSPDLPPAVAITATPRANRQVLLPGINLAAIAMTTTVTANLDYGALNYGNFLDTTWRELRKAEYFYSVEIPDPASSTPIERYLDITSRLPMSSSLQSVTPVLSPPKAPQINGTDAFSTRIGVGIQPVLSWSSPAIGRPTSYQVRIEKITDRGPLAILYATIRSGTSLRVPPDVLALGSRYIATITAIRVSGDTDRLETEADFLQRLLH